MSIDKLNVSQGNSQQYSQEQQHTKPVTPEQIKELDIDEQALKAQAKNSETNINIQQIAQIEKQSQTAQHNVSQYNMKQPGIGERLSILA